MKLDVTSVTIHAPEPLALADFYARLLGVEVKEIKEASAGLPPEAGWAQVEAGRLTLNFEYEALWETPVWPSVPDRPTTMEHLDIETDDLEAAEAHALECGARLADIQPNRGVRVLLDPAGHPFCLFR